VVVSLAVAVAFASGVFSSGDGGSANVAGRLDGEPIVLNHAPERVGVRGGDLWAMATDAGELSAPSTTETERGSDNANAPFDPRRWHLPPTSRVGFFFVFRPSVWQTHANPTVGGTSIRIRPRRYDGGARAGIKRTRLRTPSSIRSGIADWATTAPARGSGKLGALVRIDPESAMA
jgi:hypothetical protein